jgi:uncharacterized membrane protein
MALYLVSYVVVLAVFLIVDFVWLNAMSGALYRPTIGDALLKTPRFAPLIVFYLLYPVGAVVFAVTPALVGGSYLIALMSGALFGLFAYATYDLANFATLRNWTLKLTVIDIVWGALSTSAAATASYAAVVALAPKLGLLAR